ncbi:hypothetical protein BaRGS_00027255 [Batillaria attramentaria]|uniref:Uncharacterized protein n=1 Tax=Batillaria attramentaria TaxID=370345 RepID=A0ABD0K3D8_9CAEN
MIPESHLESRHAPAQRIVCDVTRAYQVLATLWQEDGIPRICFRDCDDTSEKSSADTELETAQGGNVWDIGCASCLASRTHRKQRSTQVATSWVYLTSNHPWGAISSQGYLKQKGNQSNLTLQMAEATQAYRLDASLSTVLPASV